MLDPSISTLIIVAIAIIYYANHRSRPSREPSHHEHTSEVPVESGTERGYVQKAIEKSSELTALFVPQESEAPESLSTWKIIILPVVGSVMLLVLFYFLNILKYLLVVFMSISSLGSISFVLYPLWSTLIVTSPLPSRFYTFPLPRKVHNCLGVTRVPVAVAISMAFSAFLITLWLCTSNWLVVDLIATCLVIGGIMSLQLPSAKLATLMLVLFWVYDIFWVFISPLIFPKNVMETVAVATSELDLPMVIKLPRMLAYVPQNGVHSYKWFAPLFNFFVQADVIMHQVYSPGFILLGLGDIMLPGLALNFFFRRDDILNEKQVAPSRISYYLVSQIGYGFGLILTFFMLVLLDRGQPALLYLVPCVLAPPFILAWRRSSFLWLWNSLPTDETHFSTDESPQDHNLENELELETIQDTAIPMEDDEATFPQAEPTADLEKDDTMIDLEASAS